MNSIHQLIKQTITESIYQTTNQFVIISVILEKELVLKINSLKLLLGSGSVGFKSGPKDKISNKNCRKKNLMLSKLKYELLKKERLSKVSLSLNGSSCCIKRSKKSEKNNSKIFLCLKNQ